MFMAIGPDEILTIEELSAYLKVSKSTLYQMAQKRTIPASKVGKHWRFHKATIERWLLRNPEQQGPKSEPSREAKA
jgi:excisionase family DNA binding protein